MSMFPHSVTVYNVDTVVDKETLEDKEIKNITVLRGVFLDASKASNVRQSGLEGADAANLYIPFSVDAVDGATGEQKPYMGPIEFWKMDDKNGYWTLSDGGNTFFIKGEVVEPDMSRQQIEAAFDNVYSVTKVDEKDVGNLKHWEVGGA